MKIMRRNDKKITEDAELWQVIDDSPYVVVAFNAEEPYAVPLDFSRVDSSIYVHCAPKGRKMDIMAKNNEVFLLFVNYKGTFCHTPGVACGISTRFTSVMARGVAALVDDAAEKEKAFYKMLDKHNIDRLPMPEAAVNKTCVFKVDILEMSGKRNPAEKDPARISTANQD